MPLNKETQNKTNYPTLHKLASYTIKQKASVFYKFLCNFVSPLLIASSARAVEYTDYFPEEG